MLIISDFWKGDLVTQVELNPVCWTPHAGLFLPHWALFQAGNT